MLGAALGVQRARQWVRSPPHPRALLAAGTHILSGAHVAGWVVPHAGVLNLQLAPGCDRL